MKKKNTMKKITILLLAILYIGITNVNAQTDAKKVDSKVIYEKGDQKIIEVEDTSKKCAKNSEKACNSTCENKKTGTCCEGKKAKSSCKDSKTKCSKSKEGSFNFNNSNSYGNKKSKCCKSKEKKECASTKKTKGPSPSKSTEEISR